MEATGILDAKNKFRAKFPTHQIISCVKLGEVDPSTKVKRQADTGMSFTGTLLGAAAAAGIGFFLKNKFKK